MWDFKSSSWKYFYSASGHARLLSAVRINHMLLQLNTRPLLSYAYSLYNCSVGCALTSTKTGWGSKEIGLGFLCRVHNANKLAAKHDRVELSKAAESATCDICQDRPAVLFCSEDRALICRR